MFRGNKHPFTHSTIDKQRHRTRQKEKITTTITQPNLIKFRFRFSFVSFLQTATTSFVINDPELHNSIKGYRCAKRNSKPTSHQETNAQLQEKTGVANIGKTVGRHL